MASHSIGVSSRNLNNIQQHHHQLQQHHNSSSNNSTSSNSGVGLVSSGNKMMKTPIAWTARDANLSSRPASTLMSYNISASSAAAAAAAASMSHFNMHNSHLTEEQQEHLKINSNSRLQGHNMHVTPQNVHQQNVHLVSRHPPKSRYHHHQANVLSARTSGHLNVHHQHRASSPSATTITSSDDREEVPMVRHQRRSHHGPMRDRGVSSDRRSVISRVSRPASYLPATASYDIYSGPHQITASNVPATSALPSIIQAHPHLASFNTLKSSKSVPAIAYPGMDDQSTVGPGCPVHHHGEPLTLHPSHLPFVYAHPPPGSAAAAAHSDIHTATLMRRVGSVVDLRSLAPSGIHSLAPSSHHPTAYSVVNFDTGKKSYRHFAQVPLQASPQAPPPPPPSALAHAMTLHPHHAHSLMMQATLKRNNSKRLNSKQLQDIYVDDNECCKGHLIVLWIILTVVTLGVISGIVLAVTMN